MTSRLYSIYDLPISDPPGKFGFELFNDLADLKNLDILFNGPRPDVVVENGNIHCYRTILLL